MGGVANMGVVAHMGGVANMGVVAHMGGVTHVGEVPPVASLGATVLWGMMMLLGTKISNLKFKEDKMISPFQTRLATYLTASR